jgi:hypothetical protein
MQTAQKFTMSPQNTIHAATPGKRSTPERVELLPEVVALCLGVLFILGIIHYNLSRVPYSETTKLYTNLGVAVTRTLDPNR